MLCRYATSQEFEVVHYNKALLQGVAEVVLPRLPTLLSGYNMDYFQRLLFVDAAKLKDCTADYVGLEAGINASNAVDPGRFPVSINSTNWGSVNTAMAGAISCRGH